MKTPFDDWLGELRRAKMGGVTLKAGTRGRAFGQPMLMPGDFSGATFRGEVRVHPDAALALAEFTFTVGDYDTGLGKTLVTFSLPGGDGANATGSLPAPTDGSTIAVFAFDILCTPAGGSEKPLFGGALPIIGRVTHEPA